jgi:hypothetical protein
MIPLFIQKCCKIGQFFGLLCIFLIALRANNLRELSFVDHDAIFIDFVVFALFEIADFENGLNSLFGVCIGCAFDLVYAGSKGG